MKESKEKVLKKYTIELISKDDKTIIRRTCDGFGAHELLGLVTLAQQEIIHQIKGSIRPDIIERRVVRPRKSKGEAVEEKPLV